MRGVILKFTNPPNFFNWLFIFYLYVYDSQFVWRMKPTRMVGSGWSDWRRVLPLGAGRTWWVHSFIQLIWYLAWLYMYHIARNFCGRKLLQIGDYKIFAERTFADCLLVPLKDVTPQNFETFANSHKTLIFVQVFFLKIFLLYSCKYQLCA